MKKITFKSVCLELCKREKLKKQVDIAQVRELVGHISDIIFEMNVEEVGDLFYVLEVCGERRAKARVKKRKS